MYKSKNKAICTTYDGEIVEVSPTKYYVVEHMLIPMVIKFKTIDLQHCSTIINFCLSKYMKNVTILNIDKCSKLVRFECEESCVDINILKHIKCVVLHI